MNAVEVGVVIRKMRLRSRVISWIANPADDPAPSANTATPSSIHLRAWPLARSALFWSSICRICTGLPSSEPPKSSTASSDATLLPGPPTSL